MGEHSTRLLAAVLVWCAGNFFNDNSKDLQLCVMPRWSISQGALQQGPPRVRNLSWDLQHECQVLEEGSKR